MSIELESSYHEIPLSPKELKVTVNKLSKKIKLIHSKYKLSHIVCTGISGQAVSWPLSVKTGIPICVVRKAKEESHGSTVEGVGILKNFVIIDDFIASGDTIKRITKQLLSKNYPKTKKTPLLNCKGVILYNSLDKTKRSINKFPIMYV